MSQMVKKVVLVTGGSSGIGEITAIEFAKLGFQVAITGLEQADLDRVFELLVASSPTNQPEDFLTLQANFEDPNQVEGLVEGTVAKFGQLDILVNNAGLAGKQVHLTHEEFYDDYRRVMQVNLSAPVRLAQLAAPHLLKTRGVIINTSSILGQLAASTISYNLSKAGMSMLTKCLAISFSGSGVRVVAVAPGPVETGLGNVNGHSVTEFAPIVPLRRIAQPMDVANAIVFLASDKASYINGTVVEVDGGFTAYFGGVFGRFAKPLHEVHEL